MEEERAGGHRGAGGAAVAAFDDSSELLNGDFASTDIDECANYGANHVAQETVGSDFKNPHCGPSARCGVSGFAINSLTISSFTISSFAIGGILSAPSSMGDVADVGFYICVKLGEGSKVFCFKENGSRLIHLAEIEGGGCEP